MKHTLILLLLIAITCSITAQDLIVTNDGDSINCRITNIDNSNVHFIFIDGNEVINTMFNLSDIENFQYDFYEVSEVLDEDILGYYNYQRFRFAINGGYSYMTAKIAKNVPADHINYFKRLKSGYHFGGDISYYYYELFGVGAKSFVFKASNKMDDIYLEDSNGNRRFGKMSDDVTIFYVGPMASTRYLSRNKRNAFIVSMSVGYMGYSNDIVFIDKNKMKGSTVGMAFDIGYDIGISKNFSLGFQFSFLSGSLSKYTLSDGIITETVKLEKDDYENISRIDFSIGLRFGR